MRTWTTTICIAVLLSSPASANTFSFDWESRSVGLADSFFGIPLTPGDVCTNALPGAPGPNPPLPGPLPAPGLQISAAAGGPGFPAGGLGILPAGLFAVPEVDALSYGRDIGHGVVFSVDEWATGLPGPAAPDVMSEGATGNREAAADVFWFLSTLAPTALGPPVGNTDLIDGDGLFPAGQPGVGLIEPNPPAPGPPAIGDNLDAVDVDTLVLPAAGPIFFSMDSAFPDPLEGVLNTGTAAANGFVGGDVLAGFVAGVPFVYAPAFALGLDLVAGPDSDDLDALALFDDGNLIFTPGTGTDILYFSVRRGSAVIGMPDSALGLPIEEGDILTAPPVPGALPAIVIPAEVLGLTTARSGTSVTGLGDELDALDTVPGPPACNDGIDNDGDGEIDFGPSCTALGGSDCGCSSPGDDSELDQTGVYLCDDGIDNDGDARTDFLDDSGCRKPAGLIENPACNDGNHNDFDGRIDFDGGAEASQGGALCTASGAPFQCCTGAGAGCAGPPDPECVGKPWRDKEKLGCGLGFELALVLPLLVGLRRRRRS